MPDTRIAREREALRRQEGSHLEPGQQPDAQGAGAESLTYTDPSIDPQWLDAWKMFVDRDGVEYGVPVRVPRGQWDAGGPSALSRLRRPDGGYWFTLVEPERLQVEPQYECFVGECRKRLHKRIQLVQHVRAFHNTEAEAYKEVLLRIEQQVAQDDPRLQRVLASLEQGPSEEVPIACSVCEQLAPEEHPDPGKWLRGHMMGAHKEGK